MTWEEFSRLMLCIGKLEGLSEALPEATANWLHSVVADLREIADRQQPGRTRDGRDADASNEPNEQAVNGREIITIKCSRNISDDQYDDNTPQESRLFIEKYILTEAMKHIRYGIVGEGRAERIVGYLRIVGGAEEKHDTTDSL
jgi:hypothetical protein